MSNAFTQFAHSDQVPTCAVENLSLDDEIVASAFWRLRDPEPYGEVQARHAILYGFEHGYWGATEAFAALESRGLFGDVEQFMRTYAAGVWALASALQSSEERSDEGSPFAGGQPDTYANSSVLEVLANVRRA